MGHVARGPQEPERRGQGRHDFIPCQLGDSLRFLGDSLHAPLLVGGWREPKPDSGSHLGSTVDDSDHLLDAAFFPGQLDLQHSQRKLDRPAVHVCTRGDWRCFRLPGYWIHLEGSGGACP